MQLLSPLHPGKSLGWGGQQKPHGHQWLKHTHTGKYQRKVAYSRIWQWVARKPHFRQTLKVQNSPCATPIMLLFIAFPASLGLSDTEGLRGDPGLICPSHCTGSPEKESGSSLGDPLTVISKSAWWRFGQIDS